MLNEIDFVKDKLYAIGYQEMLYIYKYICIYSVVNNNRLKYIFRVMYVYVGTRKKVRTGFLKEERHNRLPSISSFLSARIINRAIHTKCPRVI